MANTLVGTYSELEALRAGLSAASAAGGMQLNDFVNEFIRMVDIVGRAMEATKNKMEESDRRYTECSQMLGLHSSSISSLQS